MLRLVGLLLMAFAVRAAIAPPFSGFDTLPATGAVALAIILEDVVVLAIGAVIGTGGIILILTVGAAIVRVLQRPGLTLLPPTRCKALLVGRPLRPRRVDPGPKRTGRRHRVSVARGGPNSYRRG